MKQTTISKIIETLGTLEYKDNMSSSMINDLDEKLTTVISLLEKIDELSRFKEASN